MGVATGDLPQCAGRVEFVLDILARFVRLSAAVRQVARGAPPERAAMRYVILACMCAIAVGIAVDLGLLMVTSGDPVESFDPRDAAAESLVAENALRKLQIVTRDFLQDLIDGFTGAYREQIQRRFPTAPLPQ